MDILTAVACYVMLSRWSLFRAQYYLQYNVYPQYELERGMHTYQAMALPTGTQASTIIGCPYCTKVSK